MEKKIIIRNVEEIDIDDIVELSKICFPNMEPWTRAHLKSHIEIFPEGQFCVEFDGEIIGASSSLVIDFNEYEDRHTYDKITDNGYITNQDPDGKHLYGIAIMVHPDYRRLHIGTRLYEKRKELVQRLNLKSFLVGIASLDSSDFVVFPETFTIQLLSFLGEKNPGQQVRRIAEYTEQYIEHFSDLAGNAVPTSKPLSLAK